MSTSKKIVAIGGGSVGAGETLNIDKEIVKLSGKNKPKTLFIPTASYDDLDYWKEFKKTYHKRLGCKTDLLLLLKETPTKKEMRDKILSADIIYVGGGNTLKMIRRWRYLGVDKLIKQAYNKGTVCCGLSAGALCWFKYGHSDSEFYYHPDNWDYIRVLCLGFVPVTLCPHYDTEKRDKSFQKMIKSKGGFGVALDNNCAIEIVDDQYKIVTSTNTAQAYTVRKRRGKIMQQVIVKQARLSPLKQLC